MTKLPELHVRGTGTLRHAPLRKRDMRRIRASLDNLEDRRLMADVYLLTKQLVDAMTALPPNERGDWDE